MAKLPAVLLVTFLFCFAGSAHSFAEGLENGGFSKGKSKGLGAGQKVNFHIHAAPGHGSLYVKSVTITP